MGMTIGDTVFNTQGKPGVIKAKDTVNGQLQVENQGPQFEKQRRLGYINGVPAERREEFNQIVTAVRAESDPEKQVAIIMQKVNELRTDPKNYLLAKYLQSEAAHIMNTSGVQPREYTIGQDSVRT